MKKLVTILVLVLSLSLAAQEVPQLTEQQLENLADDNPEDDALLQSLQHFKMHPLNINTATADEWQALRLLTDLQIANLMQYRKLFGALVTVYELQAVPGFDLLTLKRLRPFVYAGSTVPVKEEMRQRFGKGQSYILLRFARQLEKAKGYDTALNTHYLGSPDRLQLRYRYQYKTLLYYGFVADKDAGEQLFKGSQKAGFDFYSAHLFARNVGCIKAVAIGDYVVNLGQGLTQWQSLGFGKSAEVLNTKRQSAVLLPYRSAGEFAFNRGAAATLEFGNWEATGFASMRKLGGNLQTDSDRTFITSLNTSGYYRTPSELRDKGVVTNFSYGGNVAYKHDRWQVGVNAVLHQFSLPLQKSAEPYNAFAFSGRRQVNMSVDYSYTYNNIHLFGEAASSQATGKALVQGALISAGEKMDISLLYRNVSARYTSLFANAFTENSLPGNEEGFYMGLVLRPKPHWQLAAYADRYRFPFIRYRANAPTHGWDYLVQLTWVPNKTTELYLRYRTEDKPLHQTGDVSALRYPASKIKQQWRFQFSVLASENLTLKSRTEWMQFAKGSAEVEHGFLTYMEGSSRISGKVRANLRLQYFETGGYNSRIYVYESDVLYSFAVPAYFDKGIRTYLNVQVEAIKKLSFWFRIAQTIYQNKQAVGSGLDENQGNRRTELKTQLVYSF